MTTEPPQYDKVTDCECPLAGWCSRHRVTKSKHLHKLCQTRPAFFQMWEECRGPMQFCTKEDVEDIKQQRLEEKEEQKCHEEMVKKIKMPSAKRQALNFAKAIGKHAASGFKRLDTEEKEKRLEICRGCEFYISHSQRCSKCGCFLQTKTGWASQHCPIGKW